MAKNESIQKFLNVKQDSQLQSPNRSIQKLDQTIDQETNCASYQQSPEQSKFQTLQDQSANVPLSISSNNQLFSSPTIDQSNYEHITEEALDDWIAQSSNRPIISYMDPYKKFNAPASLIQNFKARYRKWLVTKERDHEKKRLYFEEAKKDNTSTQVANRLYMNVGRKKQLRSDLIYRFDQLVPKQLPGIPIQIREQSQWTHCNNSMMDGIREDCQEKMNESQHLNRSQALSSSPRTKGRSRQKGRPVKLLSIIKSEIKYMQQEEFRNATPGKEALAGGNSQEEGQSPPRTWLKKLAVHRSATQDKRQSGSESQSPPSSSKKGLQRPFKISLLKQMLQPQLKTWDRQSKKAITARVDKLLSEDHDKQIRFNNKDVENYQQHAPEILDLEKKDKQNLDNVDFNFIRAVQKIRKGNYESALNCLKQTLQYDKLHFKTIFNMACMYERMKKFDIAIKWFELLMQFPLDQQQDSQSEIKYGLALCYYKTGQQKECYRKIIPLAEEDDLKEEGHRQDIQYLR